MTQFVSYEFLNSCDGVGGHHEGVGSLDEIPGEIVGGICGFLGDNAGRIGGIDEGVLDQHVGKVWRFEEGGDRKGEQAWTHGRRV